MLTFFFVPSSLLPFYVYLILAGGELGGASLKDDFKVILVEDFYKDNED